MINTEYFANKKVTVVGLARSGFACARLLRDLGAEVWVTDSADNETIRRNAFVLKQSNVEVEIGRHTEDFIRGRDYVIVSPGVGSGVSAVVWARERDIPVISEIEAAFILCPAPIIAVTGSNGKTTVTTLIGSILKAAGRKVFVCGNIGNPFSGEVHNISKDDFVVLEISSFQLETIKGFKPKIALILNINRNHLDRYSCMEEYIRAKERIFLNQDESDYLIVNSADPQCIQMAKDACSEVLYFSQDETFNPNEAAVLAVGSILGIESKLSREVFKEFKGIEHRLEYVGETDGVVFINDSKSTTAEATVWALRNISRPVILIAGGRDKGVDYSVVLKEARDKVKHIIVIGEAADKIIKALGDSFTVEIVSTMKEAVVKAHHKACRGDCVLLSPMCSSYDMFKDYTHRGRVFKNEVFALI